MYAPLTLVPLCAIYFRFSKVNYYVYVYRYDQYILVDVNAICIVLKDQYNKYIQ